MAATILMTAAEARAAGWVVVGEWGTGSSDAGRIWSRPADKAAVRSAYEVIEDGDLGPWVLSDVTAAGGVYIRD